MKKLAVLLVLAVVGCSHNTSTMPTVSSPVATTNSPLFSGWETFPESGAGTITPGKDGAVWYVLGSGGLPYIGRMDALGNTTHYPLNSGYSLAACMQCIVRNPDGNVYFTETDPTGIPAIGQVSQQGVVVDQSLPLPSDDHFTGLTSGKQGFVYAGHAGSTNGVIEVPWGSQTNDWTTPTAPGLLALGSDFRIWSPKGGTSGNIIALDRSIGTLTEYPGSGTGIASLPLDGSLWISQTGVGMLRIDPATGAQTAYPLSKGQSRFRPALLVAGRHGLLFWPDVSKLARYSTQRHVLLTAWPYPNQVDYWMTVGPDGNLWSVGWSAIVVHAQ